jgi:hypothetical protein
MFRRDFTAVSPGGLAFGEGGVGPLAFTQFRTQRLVLLSQVSLTFGIRC